jgi:hypothetical protein
LCDQYYFGICKLLIVIVDDLDGFPKLPYNLRTKHQNSAKNRWRWRNDLVSLSDFVRKLYGSMMPMARDFSHLLSLNSDER